MKGILLNTDIGDILIDNSSRLMVIGDIATQNAKLIIEANKGELKEQPMRGVGLDSFAEGHTVERLVREIRREFFFEGLQISSLRINEQGIELDVNYK